MRYGALFQAQCASLRWLRSEDEVSMASSFVSAWRASAVNESLDRAETAAVRGEAQVEPPPRVRARKVAQLSFLFLSLSVRDSRNGPTGKNAAGKLKKVCREAAPQLVFLSYSLTLKVIFRSHTSFLWASSLLLERDWANVRQIHSNDGTLYKANREKICCRKAAIGLIAINLHRGSFIPLSPGTIILTVWRAFIRWNNKCCLSRSRTDMCQSVVLRTMSRQTLFRNVTV